MDDYDLECLPVVMFMGIIIGGFISAFISIPYENVTLFITMWIIFFSMSIFGSSFLENKPKQALKLNGIIFGMVIATLSIIFFFIDFIFNWKVLLVLLIVLAELYYWIDKKKPKKRNKILFTAERKGLSFLYVSLAMTVLLGFYNLIKRLHKFLIEYYPIILKWLGYIGLVMIIIAAILGILYGYIWLNSLKYERRK